jgi:predicted AlkP superfamily phosphohydrolase/phosphomutase
MLTPRLRGIAGTPGRVVESLRSQVPDYTVDVEWAEYEGEHERLVADLTSMTQARARAFRYLLDTEPWDFAQVVFVSTDRFQHAMWPWLLGDGAAQREECYRRLALDFFHRLDEALGTVMGAVPAETNVVILSDHGFQASTTQFITNEWLARHGWLDMKEGALRFLYRLRSLEPSLLQRWRRRLLPQSDRLVKAKAIARGINWSGTRAYCTFTSDYTGISINQVGREPDGVVQPGHEYEQVREDLRDALLQARNPRDGRELFAGVHRREDVYPPRSAYFEIAPDLLLEPARGVALGPHASALYEETGWASGSHAMNGILIGTGPSMRSDGESVEARLIDIAPTVLQLFGLPVPEAMQGRVLSELLATEVCVERKEISLVQQPDGSEAYGEDDRAAVEERLRGLGYL